MSSGSKTGTAAAEARVHRVWLALGTNLGDRAGNLARAIMALDDVLQVEQLSGVYETEPFGYADQPVFWNMALRGTTDLPPRPLLAELQEIERRVGRTQTFRMGPRVLDIDILMVDDIIIEDDTLRVPHPAMTDRPFVMVPLIELDSGLLHPASGKPLVALEAALDRAGVTRLGDAADMLPLSSTMTRP